MVWPLLAGTGLARDPAAHVPLDDPDAWLLDSLREAGANDQVTARCYPVITLPTSPSNTRKLLPGCCRAF
jgi:hypothetical protein